jgi:adenylate cyclase
MVVGMMVLLTGLGVLDRPDLTVSDALYQERVATEGRIVIVGIDQKALDKYGPYQMWSREGIARTLEMLNVSEESRPAVIGVDILFSGESDEEVDKRLAEAAGEYGNVVVASAAQYGIDISEVDGGYRMDEFYVSAYGEPYKELVEAAECAHINAMLDVDGILRHHLLSVRLPDGEVVDSMALTVANRYRESRGERAVLEPPTDKRGFWYLPYCGEPEDFFAVSIVDVLEGEISADYFAGKIVLIGPWAAGLQDAYFTAIDHARQMYGVEYQANAVQVLLWEDYRQEVGGEVQLVILAVLLLLAIVVFQRRSLTLSTILWIVLGGGWILLCIGLYHAGWVLHVLWIPVNVTVLYAGGIVLHYVRAARERQAVTNTFKRYVAPEIVAKLLKEGKEALLLGGNMTEIAVLFVDVRGFTTMSEKLAPTKVVEILNRYLTLISECILKNGGTLDKFVGDAAMAFWGAPLKDEDAVMHAARAAMDMVDGSKALAVELLEQYGQAVSFGIGIHFGEAVVGNIGSPNRMDYTAIGDTVNTAARLEANAPGGTIYISRAVADALEGRIKTTSLGGTVKLKGKTEGFEVLTLDEVVENG